VARARKRRLAEEVVARWPELAGVAEELIETGSVLVNGVPRTNLNSLVADTESIRIVTDSGRLRGHTKLSRALDLLGIDPRGAVALDAGASAGGFTQVLLDRGALRVYAVEVGYGQLLGSLRQDGRVVNLERTNIGSLDRGLVPDELDAVTLDIGYLPLATAVPQLDSLGFSEAAWLLALVKPMTELRLSELPRDDESVDRATAIAAGAITEAGWKVQETIRSPVRGAHGAVEAWVHARRR
jgi:23S rRNA (cytidine1920-2'-O)/16S rRNA (cytidine1409-2'-O)-methyltransferase